jgi:hypothetical protein
MIRVEVPIATDALKIEHLLQEAGIPHHRGVLQRGTLSAEMNAAGTAVIYHWIDIESTPYEPGSLTPG